MCLVAWEDWGGSDRSLQQRRCGLWGKWCDQERIMVTCSVLGENHGDMLSAERESWWHAQCWGRIMEKCLEQREECGEVLSASAVNEQWEVLSKNQVIFKIQNLSLWSFEHREIIIVICWVKKEHYGDLLSIGRDLLWLAQNKEILVVIWWVERK